MAYEQPEESLETPNNLRSLNIVLGAREYFLITGLIVLAAGFWLAFGFEYALMIVGGVLIATAWIDAVVD